jgi:leader peptidase (prepilin peptidase)/N-methyltransferase
VELLTGALFLVAVHLLVLRHPGGVFRPGAWLHFGIVAPVLAALVALTFIDLDHRILPDRITKPGMAAGAVASLLLPSLQPTAWIPSLPPAGAALLLAAAGMLLGYGSLWAVGWMGERMFRREAMGLGDAKLLAMIGAFTGPVGVAEAAGLGLLLGLLLGLAYRLRTGDPEFPFGPALAAGGAAAVLAPAEVREGAAAFAAWVAESREGMISVLTLCGLAAVAVRDRLPRPLFLAILVLLVLLAILQGTLHGLGGPGGG